MQICKLGQDKLHGALDLIWEVFAKYEAPDYDDMGIETFRHFIDYHNMLDRLQKGQMKFWGCYIGNYLVGVIGMREGQHISLLFVREKFHHLGIARNLVKMGVEDVLAGDPEVRAVTVNSSPYAVGFYRRLGFEALGPEETANGIRYTSMRLDLD
ncbi:MAG: GNAT family N-acetyltransferase [Eubacterium sp.]|nr:GNAT family N-acetyltransferase [Eubacterium sp.]